MSESYLVTGGAGLIGFELVRQLVTAGEQVVAIDNGSKGGMEDLEALAGQYPRQLQVVNGDLAHDAACLQGAYTGIFHLAAIVGVRRVMDNPYETIWVNMRATLNVLDHALQTGCKAFVFASSSENYASCVDAGFVAVPTPEDVLLGIADPSLPRWSYAASKIAGESAIFAAAAKAGFHPQVVRFHNVYGPRMALTHVIPELLDRCRRKVDPFPVYGWDQTRSFLHVEDAGRALRLLLGAARNGCSGVFNIGSPQEVRVADLAKLIFDITGHHPQVEQKPAPAGSVTRRAPDISRLGALGFEQTIPLEAGIRDCW